MPVPPPTPDFLDRLDLSLQRAFDLLSRGALDRGFDREAVSLRLHTER